jgi:hypothetical protein
MRIDKARIGLMFRSRSFLSGLVLHKCTTLVPKPGGHHESSPPCGTGPFVFLFAAPFARAQCPIPSAVILNFRPVANTPTTFKFAWDAPPGASANAAYEILRETDANYCAYTGNTYAVVDTITATSYTAALPAPSLGSSVSIAFATW